MLATLEKSRRAPVAPPVVHMVKAVEQGFLVGPGAAGLAAGTLALVAFIAYLDYVTGPLVSFSVFYLIPVGLCAWNGGLSYGILLSIAGTVAWSTVDAFENPTIPETVMVWNGVVRFGTLVLASSLVSRLRGSILRERLLARTDALTGAANGRTFYASATIEADRARRGSRPLTLAYLDLDNFKQLNDRLGHAAGDAALVHFAQTVQLNLRGSDILARLGGDEFALLLPDTDAAGAAALFARLQEVLAREMARKDWPLTVSVGAVTFLHPSLDVDQMVQRVDALMYSAKRKGKGRVEYAVAEDRPAKPPGGEKLERRAAARVLSDRTARVRREGQEDATDNFAIVRDLSLMGIGLHLDQEYPADTLLVIEPLAANARTLLARVVRTSPENGGWLHGCVLRSRLKKSELRAWLGQHFQDARKS